MKQEDINKIVCDYFKIESLVGIEGSRKYKTERQIAQYLGKFYTDETVESIGKKTGRNHSTVSQSAKKILFGSLKFSNLQKDLNELVKLIKNKNGISA